MLFVFLKFNIYKSRSSCIAGFESFIKCLFPCCKENMFSFLKSQHSLLFLHYTYFIEKMKCSCVVKGSYFCQERVLPCVIISIRFQLERPLVQYKAGEKTFESVVGWGHGYSSDDDWSTASRAIESCSHPFTYPAMLEWWVIYSVWSMIPTFQPWVWSPCKHEVEWTTSFLYTEDVLIEFSVGQGINN